MNSLHRTASRAELGRPLDELLSCLAKWSERDRLGNKHAPAHFDLEMSKDKKLRAIVEGSFLLPAAHVTDEAKLGWDPALQCYADLR